MEAVSGVAAVMQLAEMAGKTALELYSFVSIVKNAPEEINAICRDVHAFYTLVCNLKESLHNNTIREIVARDTEISRSLQTLETPLRNCRSVLDRVMEKIKPHLKADSKFLGRSDFLWYFKRREIYALSTELERSKATFGDSMGSITLLLALKTSAIVTGNKTPAKHEFSDDLGSALTKYAESVADADQRIILSNGSEVGSADSLGAEALRSDPEGAEELKSAVLNSSTFIVKAVLKYVHVDARDRRGRTALSHAAEHGKFEIAESLIDAGASISRRQWSITAYADGYNPYVDSGATAIHWAAKNGHTNVLNLLLQHGANPNARTTEGGTPLHGAGNSIECVKLLLSKNADVNARSYSDGWAALHIAIFHSLIELAQLLLHHGASPNIPLIQPDSKTPLHFAAETQSLDSAKLLIKHGAELNSLMLEDVTPLHLAAAGGWVPGIELFVRSGAYIDARDALLHETPLHKAARNCEMVAIKKLCDMGSNTQAKNVDGQTYQEVLELATVSPKDWRVPNHLASYQGTNLWWAH